jgi:endo-1,4-beta-xylanase
MGKTAAVVFSVLLLATFVSCASKSQDEIKFDPLPPVISLPAAPAPILAVESMSTSAFGQVPVPTIKPAPEVSSTTQTIGTLRSLARSSGLLIGTAVAAGPLRSDPIYSETIAREFNILTPENAMKFKPIHPARNTYDFKDSDTIVDFAERNNISVHGHTLVWHNQLPTWLTGQNWSRDELMAILREHIMTVVGRYKGRIIAWDVVNEAIADNGSLRDNFWMKGIGPEYIEMAFRWAHEADPSASLFYNDYGGEGKGRKADAIFELVRGLLQHGVPINGVGLQMHVCADSCPAPLDVAWNINRLAACGLEIYITEMDVRIKSPSTESKLTEAAHIYRNMLDTFLSAKNSKAFIMWGFTDHFSWITSAFPGWEPGLIFDRSYQPQPAYTSLSSCLCE